MVHMKCRAKGCGQEDNELPQAAPTFSGRVAIGRIRPSRKCAIPGVKTGFISEGRLGLP